MSTITRAMDGIALRRSADVEVIDRALRGDSLAFSEVYRRYYDRVFAYCLSRLLSREAASDAAQEVFLRTLSAEPAGIRNPTSWLFGVARNVCTDVARSAFRDAPADSDDLGADDVALSSEAAAEDSALSKQAAATVLLALRRTNPRYRSALILREIHGQPMDDVAAALGVSTASAYTVLSRARDAFGKAYADVLDLPKPCRHAVEMVYRRSGTGLSAGEDTALEAHLSGCARCRREAAKAKSGKPMRALLPLLPWASPHAQGILARAVATFGAQAWPTQMAAISGAEWSAAKITTAAMIAAGLVVTAAMTPPLFSMPRPGVDATANGTGGAIAQGTESASVAPPVRGEATQAEYRAMRRQQERTAAQTTAEQRARTRARNGAGTSVGAGAHRVSSEVRVRSRSASADSGASTKGERTATQTKQSSSAGEPSGATPKGDPPEPGGPGGSGPKGP